MEQNNETCPKCGSQLGAVEETPSGKRLKRCSKGKWNSETRSVEGCDYVKWMEVPPQQLEETCPKCGASLVLQTTRFGKKMKKCSAGGWDKETKKVTGCDYVEWINGTSETLDESCPKCGQPLVLFTTTNGKKMKKCSTGGWDKEAKKPTGCDFVIWLKAGYQPKQSDSEVDFGFEEF